MGSVVFLPNFSEISARQGSQVSKGEDNFQLEAAKTLQNLKGVLDFLSNALVRTHSTGF